jgi:RHS repeat-associated protein
MTDRCLGSYLPACSGGELSHLEYWPTGQLRKAVTADGSYNEFTYDDAHRLVAIRDGANNKIAYTLDALGNRILENTYDPNLVLKRTHSRVFNTLNQLWKEVNAAGTAGVTTTFSYDNDGNPTTIAAPLGRTGTTAWDELGRPRQTTDPLSGITRFEFDANDNLASITDPRGLVTSYKYTGFADLRSLSSPDTGTSSNTYDSAGNLATSTDARSTVATQTYDALGRIATAAYRLGATTDQTLKFTFDDSTNGKGRLSAASDGLHSMAWTYDAKGRVNGKSQSVTSSGAVLAIGYVYNAQGQLGTVRLPSGKTLRFGFDPNGQVKSVALMGTPNTMILSNATYDPFGPITGWTWGNGITTTRVFDADGKISGTASSSATVGNRTLSHDDAFRITGTVDSAAGGPSWNLGYDLLDRLNAASKAGTAIGYTYDANGNRLTQTGTSESTYQVSATSNRLSSTAGALVRAYAYDATGNPLTTGATTHSYYNSGRMKTASLGSAGATTYVYNALGQRVMKSGGAISKPVYFMYDEAGHLVGEYNWNNGVLAVVQETVWLGDIPVATLRNMSGTMKVFQVHADHLNTPRKVTTDAGVPVLKWKWDPTPFGEGNPVEPNGNFKYNLRFPGQYFDVESNLSYNYFRDYDAALGRYVESDPIGLAAGMNTYGYVKGMPLSHIDPFGLQTAGPCPMGQRSRPLPGAVNGYQCFDDPDAANDPPYCPTGSCAVYPREPLKPVPTCEERCEYLLQKCRNLAWYYTPALKISTGLVSAAGGRAGGAGGTTTSTITVSATQSAPNLVQRTTGMTEAGIYAGCEAGGAKCKKDCECNKPK